MARDGEVLIGVIADTHGHFPSRVTEVFNGVDLIIHALRAAGLKVRVPDLV